jgi:hypothetical protein
VALSLEKYPVPILREAGLAPRRVSMEKRYFVSTVLRTQRVAIDYDILTCLVDASIKNGVASL